MAPLPPTKNLDFVCKDFFWNALHIRSYIFALKVYFWLDFQNFSNVRNFNDLNFVNFQQQNNNKNIYFLEINTQPGLTSISLVPEQLKHKNISFDNLIHNIINSSL